MSARKEDFDFREYERILSSTTSDSDAIQKLESRYNCEEDAANRQDYSNKSIMLVGSSGSGKSTLCNMIWNNSVGVKQLRYPFPVSDKLTTKTSVLKIRGYMDYFSIIDTPGLNSSKDEDEVANALFDITNTLYRGIHCLIIVMRESRITEETINVLSAIKTLMASGENGGKIIFICTGRDSTKPVVYSGDTKKNSLVQEYVDDKENQERYRDTIKYFLDLADDIIECSLGHDEDPEDDRLVMFKKRTSTLNLVSSSIGGAKGMIILIPPQEVFSALSSLITNIFKMRMDRQRLKGIFRAKYHKSLESLEEHGTAMARSAKEIVVATSKVIIIFSNSFLELFGDD